MADKIDDKKTSVDGVDSSASDDNLEKKTAAENTVNEAVSDNATVDTESKDAVPASSDTDKSDADTNVDGLETLSSGEGVQYEENSTEEQRKIRAEMARERIATKDERRQQAKERHDSDEKKRVDKGNAKLRRAVIIDNIKGHKKAIILVVIAIVAFAVGSFIMTGGYSSIIDSLGASQQEETDPMEGVAATIDGTHEITEKQVSDYIEQYRVFNDLKDNSAWATYLDQSGATAESVRTDAIDYYATRYAVEQKCKEDGITASDDEVQQQIDKVKDTYGLDSDDKYDEFVESMGYTDETYRSDVKYNLLQDKLVEANVEPSDPSDSQMESVANQNPSRYTGKRSYNIVFLADSGDAASVEAARQNAQNCIDQLMADGTVTLDEFKQAGDNLVNQGIAGQASEVDWDCLTALVTQYTDALDKLDVGQITTEPIQSDYGYHIIMCVESFEPDSNGLVSVTDMPQEIYDELRSDTVSQLDSQNRQNYLLSITNDHEIIINDMPDGLPYDVDMSLSTYGVDTNENVNSNDDAATGDNENADVTTDNAVDDATQTDGE